MLGARLAPLEHVMLLAALVGGCAGSRSLVDGTRRDGPAHEGIAWGDRGPRDGRGGDASEDRRGAEDRRVVDQTRDRGACTPSCAGKVCGDNGCGGSCGACQAWEVCSAGKCACDQPLPAGWPAFALSSRNPLLVATAATTLQGQDNVYAPEIQPLSGGWVMWYGGQGSDGHDRIYVATSTGGGEWRKWPSDAAPQPALDRGSSNHVNDPSVVQVGGTWYMYYTDAAVSEDDKIWLAQSTQLSGFAKVQQVLGPGAAGSWESLKVGRPAVLHEGGQFKMWYDGQNGQARHVGYATSSDGKTFVRHPQNPIFLNAGAIDVKHAGGVYVMLRESGQGTYWATSKDGVHCWVDRGQLFGKSGQPYDAYGQVTPFLQLEAGAVRAVWFGGASIATWNKNRIAAAYPAGAALPAGGGCTGCVPAGWSCSAACQNASQPAAGACAAPGSTNPGACCACSASGCEACIVGAADCHAACVNAGGAGGWCASPGSTNPSACCGCW